MSRPKKFRMASDSCKPDVSSVGHLRESAMSAHADPHNDGLQWVCFSGLPLALAKGDEGGSNPEVAEMLFLAISLATPQEFKAIASYIERMKENLLKPPGRQSYVLTACADYIEEYGRVPAKPELKAYMIAKPEVYRDMPTEGDGKGWTRLFRQVDLHRLDNLPSEPPPAEE